MIYKFKSPATGDVIMLGPQGDQLLRLAGREPSLKGIFEAADMPAVVAAWQAAIAAEEAQPAAQDDEKPAPVVLRQRLWPMIEMLRRAQQAQEPVVWGV
jgi:hypothetical protein